MGLLPARLAAGAKLTELPIHPDPPSRLAVREEGPGLSEQRRRWEIRVLHRHGKGVREIARETGLSRNIVRRRR